jgi:hypothetical protein
MNGKSRWSHCHISMTSDRHVRSETGKCGEPDFTNLLICCRDLSAELIRQRCFLQVVETADLEARKTIKLRKSLHASRAYSHASMPRKREHTHMCWASGETCTARQRAHVILPQLWIVEYEDRESLQAEGLPVCHLKPANDLALHLYNTLAQRIPLRLQCPWHTFKV